MPIMQQGSDAFVPANPVPLGRYRLLRVLGRGAMGEVWAAETPLVEEKVAVKVVLEHELSDPWVVRALDNEIATAAQLEHPGIVGVLDHGRVDMLAFTASGGRLPVGGAYVVLELLRGRSLHEFIGRFSWPEVQEVLRQLLSALGHCHARGVIHRDLKPGNLLVEAAGSHFESRPRLTLMDFGLARFFEQPGAAEKTVAGTPAYMAPEQLQGDWQAQGPWTDLYSVGCLGWTLITGAPPFGRRRTYEEFLQDHLHRQPPALDPMIGVPAAVEDWLRGLLAKSPLDRFLCAADARMSLDHLSSGMEMDGPTIEPVAPPVRRADAASMGEISLGGLLSTANLGQAVEQSDLFDDETRDEIDLPDAERFEPVPFTRPPTMRMPVPEDWRRPRIVVRHPLDGGGLSIFGLRPPRLVGRLGERDQLWEALVDAERAGAPRAVVLHGAPGTGKSRLAEWLCETAYEVAGIESLRASWSDGRATNTDLAAMFRRRLRLDGLEPQAIAGRLRQVLGLLGLEEGELDALAATLAPPDTTDDALVRFASPRERQVLFTRLATWLATLPGRSGEEAARPGLVWLDDVHQSTEAIEFASRLVSMKDAGPLVVVCTLAKVPEEPIRRRAYASFIEDPGVVSVPVGPLPPVDHRALVDSLLRFSPDLASSLTARTAGSPRFLVSVVADWVSRGALQATPEGFSVSDEVLAEVPVDPAELSRRALASALAERSAEQSASMQLAAILGSRVEVDEWRAVCARSRIRPHPELVDSWVRLHLIERLSSGFGFSHDLVRQTLLDMAEESGNLVERHRMCATIVELRGASGPETAGRVARHLLAAGDQRDALAYLLQAARGLAAMGQADRVLEWLDLWDETSRAVRLSASAPERRIAWSLRLDALWLLGSPHHSDATTQLFNEAESRRDLRGLAALHRALRFYQRGDFSDADAELRRAADYASEDVHLMTRIGLEQGRLALESGDLEGARGVLDSARNFARRAGDLRGEATVAWLRGRIEKQSGDLPAAHAAFTRAVTGYERALDRNGLARCTNELGEIARLEGDLGAARDHYREALRMMERLNSDNTDIVRVNLGLVLLASGDTTQARPLLQDALLTFRETGRMALLATTRAALLPCAAADGGWAEWDTLLLAAGRDLKKTRFVDVDLAWLLEQAADGARAVGQHHRADAALALAEAQWSALDRPDDRARVQQRRRDGGSDD